MTKDDLTALLDRIELLNKREDKILRKLRKTQKALLLCLDALNEHLVDEAS